MYLYKDDVYIVSDISEIEVNKLKIGDSIIVINNGNFISHLILKSIEYNKIHTFVNRENLRFKDIMLENIYTEDKKESLFLEYNNRLIYLYDKNEFNGQERNMHYNLYQNLFNCFEPKKKDVFFHYTNDGDCKCNYYYLGLRLFENKFLILLLINDIDIKNKNNNFEAYSFIYDDIPTPMFVIDQKSWLNKFMTKINHMPNIISQLYKINPIKEVKQIYNMMTILNVDLKTFIKYKKENKLKEINKYFNLIIKDDIYKLFDTVFEFKNVKSYFFNKNIIVTIDDEILTTDEYTRSDIIKDKINYTKNQILKPSEKLNNIENIILARLVYENTKYILHSGLDPKTGIYYIGGEDCSEQRIIYKDDESLILNYKSNYIDILNSRINILNKDYFDNFYIKKEGFYITTYNKEEQKEIMDRYKTLQTLTKRQ